jgi:hypothetical protein
MSQDAEDPYRFEFLALRVKLGMRRYRTRDLESPLPEARAADAIEATLGIWCREVSALRVARIALLAQRFRLAHGDWPKDLFALLGCPPGLEEREPLKDGRIELLVTAEDKLSIRASSSIDAWMVLAP